MTLVFAFAAGSINASAGYTYTEFKKMCDEFQVDSQASLKARIPSLR